MACKTKSMPNAIEAVKGGGGELYQQLQQSLVYPSRHCTTKHQVCMAELDLWHYSIGIKSRL